MTKRSFSACDDDHDHDLVFDYEYFSTKRVKLDMELKTFNDSDDIHSQIQLYLNKYSQYKSAIFCATISEILSKSTTLKKPDSDFDSNLNCRILQTFRIMSISQSLLKNIMGTKRLIMTMVIVIFHSMAKDDLISSFDLSLASKIVHESPLIQSKSIIIPSDFYELLNIFRNKIGSDRILKEVGCTHEEIIKSMILVKSIERFLDDYKSPELFNMLSLAIQKFKWTEDLDHYTITKVFAAMIIKCASILKLKYSHTKTGAACMTALKSPSVISEILARI